MKDDKKIRTAKEWILNLANGINPLDGSYIKDDDIVNNVHVSRCLFYVASLIDPSGNKVSKKSREYEYDFNISTDDLSKVIITERTGIANFVREINKFVPENMRPLSYSRILNWLMNNGYLEEIEVDTMGKKKSPTSSGKEIGITAEIREGIKGKYWAVEYNRSAQSFILNNIYAIIEK